MMSSDHQVSTARQNRFVIPLAAAGGVLVTLLVQRIFLGIIDIIGALVSGSIGSIWQFLTTQLWWVDVIFAAGVFVSLAFIMPIGAGLRFFSVVLRSILASAAGAVLVFIAILIVGVNNAIGGVLGTQTGFQENVASRAVGSGIWTAGGYFVNSAPLVILAGVVLWIWLQRHRHDTRVSTVSAQV